MLGGNILKKQIKDQIFNPLVWVSKLVGSEIFMISSSFSLPNLWNLWVILKLTFCCQNYHKVPTQNHLLNIRLLLSDTPLKYKSHLQNYARWKNCDLPTYSNTREGPSHAPCFKATVTVDGHTIESPEFFNTLKAAEHAAAKAALMSLSTNGFLEASLFNWSHNYTCCI